MIPIQPVSLYLLVLFIIVVVFLTDFFLYSCIQLKGILNHGQQLVDTEHFEAKNVKHTMAELSSRSVPVGKCLFSVINPEKSLI